MKKVLALVLTVAMIAAMFAFAPTASADDYKLTMRLSHVFGPTEQLAISIQEAADNIREKTGGAIDIQVFHSSQLPTYKDGLEQVDLESREPVHGFQEAGFMDGKDDAQGLGHRGFHDVTT